MEDFVSVSELVNCALPGVGSYRSKKDRFINYAHAGDVGQAHMQINSTLEFKDECGSNAGEGYNGSIEDAGGTSGL